MTEYSSSNWRKLKFFNFFFLINLKNNKSWEKNCHSRPFPRSCDEVEFSALTEKKNREESQTRKKNLVFFRRRQIGNRPERVF